MTDQDLEQRLRAWYRADIGERERAPLELRTDLATLAQTAPTPQRRWTAGWRFPPMNRFATFALAATAVAVALLIGISFILRWPNVGPSPVPGPTHTASPQPTAHAAAWAAAGNMVEARVDYTATLLLDGRALVVGGSSSGSSHALASAELYDPSSGTWTATGSMIEARQYGHTATLLRDGRVLVAGGYHGWSESRGDVILASAELYDPSTGSWTATGSMIDARSHHTATLLLDGRVLVAGGENYEHPGGGNLYALASAELYDPGTGSWTATGNLVAAGGVTATLLNDGRVLVTSGEDAGGHVLSSAELYDPASGTWTATGSMIEAREYGHTATLLSDGRVLVAGGCDPGHCGHDALASAELYDPGTGSWSATGSMVTPHTGHTATLLPDGRVLVAGGGSSWTSGWPDLVPQASAELYDPSTGTWTLTASMTRPRAGHKAMLVLDGQVLVLGGNSFFTDIDGDAELYDPGSGR